MSLTRVELEQEVEMCSGADEYRERDRTGQLILAHDAALREERDAFRNAICDVGTALGLIMPERVSHFAVEGVSAVTRLRQRVAELERDNLAYKNLFNENPSALYSQLATVTREREFYKKQNLALLDRWNHGYTVTVEQARDALQARLREVEGALTEIADPDPAPLVHAQNGSMLENVDAIVAVLNKCRAIAHTALRGPSEKEGL